MNLFIWQFNSYERQWFTCQRVTPQFLCSGFHRFNVKILANAIKTIDKMITRWTKSILKYLLWIILHPRVSLKWLFQARRVSDHEYRFAPVSAMDYILEVVCFVFSYYLYSLVVCDLFYCVILPSNIILFDKSSSTIVPLNSRISLIHIK